MIWRRFCPGGTMEKLRRRDLNAMRFIGETRWTIITVGSSFLLLFVGSFPHPEVIVPRRGVDGGEGGIRALIPWEEGAAATRQVSPNDLSSKKLLRLFLLRVTRQTRLSCIPSSAARYFFVACMAIASLFLPVTEVPLLFVLLLLRTAIRAFRNS